VHRPEPRLRPVARSPEQSLILLPPEEWQARLRPWLQVQPVRQRELSLL
jgi:hypothetical protein